MQIERDAKIRAVMPTPTKGHLSLPKEGLPQAMLECNPQAVEDLNAVVPEGSQQLSSQELNEHVSTAAAMCCLCFSLHHTYSCSVCCMSCCGALQSCCCLFAITSQKNLLIFTNALM